MKSLADTLEKLGALPEENNLQALLPWLAMQSMASAKKEAEVAGRLIDSQNEVIRLQNEIIDAQRSAYEALNLSAHSAARKRRWDREVERTYNLEHGLPGKGTVH